MVLAARERGCLAEVLVIAAALSVPDPRDRPLEKQQAADQAHLRFRDERSDFLSLIALWEFFAGLDGQGLSHRKRVDACRAQFVSFLRLTEWRDVHRQLASELADLGWQWSPALPAAIDARRYQAIHEALLTGLLSNVGTRNPEGDGYQGTRGLAFVLHPGSGLAKKAPRWVLAAELVETQRLYARVAARVEPEWIEAVAGDRVTREHFEPHWDEGRGEVVASERVQLYGLTLVPRRRVSFGAIDPAPRRARCSSARRWCPARWRPGAPSSCAQPAASSPRWRSSSTRRAARTCSSTTRRSPRSTPPGCPRAYARSPASSAGARTPNGRIRACSASPAKR